MARKRKFDMSKVESFKRCAEGIHTAKIVEVQENTTQAGDDMLTMAFEVIKGDSKGARVYDNFVLTDKALWKLKQLLQTLGVKCDGKIVLDLDKLVGKVCDITVFHEEYNGKLKARIDEYTAIKRESSDDEDDYDDDEDDEPEAEDNEPEEKPEPKKAPAKKAAAKGKKKPEPEADDDEDDDWDDDEEPESEPEEKPKKKAAKPEPKKKAPAKKKAEPEPEDDEDWDDDDEDWDE